MKSLYTHEYNHKQVCIHTRTPTHIHIHYYLLCQIANFGRGISSSSCGVVFELTKCAHMLRYLILQYAYIYIYIYIYIYMRTHVYIYIRTSQNCNHVSVYVYTCMWMYLRLCARVYILSPSSHSECTCSDVSSCNVYICTYAHTCIQVRDHVSNMHKYNHVYVCVYTYWL